MDIEKLAAEANNWGPSKRPDGRFEEEPDSVPRNKESEQISLRLPRKMLEVLKATATREKIGYQVLIKRWLDERIREEYDKIQTYKATSEETVPSEKLKFSNPVSQISSPMLRLSIGTAGAYVYSKAASFKKC